MSGPRKSLGEAWPKCVNDAAHAITELHYRFKNRLTLDKPRFVNHYLEAKLHILVFFSISSVDEQLVACFKREEIVGGANEQIGCGGLQKRGHSGREATTKASFNDRPDANTMETRPDSHNQTVFVDVVQAMEGPQIGPLASHVWFDRADRIDGVLPHTLYYSRKSGFKIFSRRRDQKAGLVTIALRAPGSDKIQLLSKVVERIPKAMENVARNGWKNGGDRLDARKIIDHLSCIWIALGGDFIGIGIKEEANCRLEIVDMFVGPFNF